MDEVPSNSTESEIVIGAVPTETTVIPVHTTKTVTEPVTTLTVSAGEDRILQLPEEDSVSLIAYVIPEPSNTTHYKYEWSVVSKPQGSTGGEIEYKHSKKVNLLKLTAGKYVFKVSVSGDHSYGETRVNVTVNPPLRINTPPVAVIFPKTQDVTLPNNQAVLDGSKSHDDDKIVSYHWEEIKGPLSGEKILGDEALLTMTDLIPGTYILKLTVVDSDGAIDATTANVSVTEATDYPPVANAGTTQAIKLPTDSVVLNGSLSTDDKGIVAYEWSKSSGGVADMQGSSKSILHLSGLEQGVYTFTLKVTDSAGQSSTASVMVIVQPENNFPPVADAGPDKEISLPNDDTTLDGSKSHDDNGITSYKWKKISGPGDVIIKDSDTIVATVSNLVEGTYVFELTVTDGEGSTNSDQVTVIVKQEIDQPPVADAGEDMVIELPQKYVAIDGSKSHDDFSITSYQWLRDPKSPAAGEIMRDSNHEAILRLTNLVVGMYKFSLRVTDAKGQHATDYMTLEVKEGKIKDTLVRQLSVLLGVMDPDIVVQSVRESPLGGVVIQFYILNADGKRVLKGITMVNKLKSKLSKESQVLDYNVMLVDTVVCQNDCSGHGHCNVETKQCICESFWMENYFKIYLGDGESNCEWSILYVVIIGSLVVVTIGGIIWAIYCCIKRRRMMRGRKRHRYTLLDEYDGREAVEMLPKSSNGKQNSSIMISETDSEEETLYEGKKTNGYKPRSKPLNGIIGRQHKRKDKKSLKPLLQPQKKTEDIDDFL
uniref:Dyslexia-associated protein KIAA0319-like n=1 Tax=Saccoglossus kowalevskii TaxID=10224 RepID=A0ABM0MRY8_SACKO|nr:PREDICTED: dyslexia-associated protein KIAA0319-like [Saccoglossus kowalevskii]